MVISAALVSVQEGNIVSRKCLPGHCDKYFFRNVGLNDIASGNFHCLRWPKVKQQQYSSTGIQSSRPFNLLNCNNIWTWISLKGMIPSQVNRFMWNTMEQKLLLLEQNPKRITTASGTTGVSCSAKGSTILNHCLMLMFHLLLFYGTSAFG